MNNSNHLGLHIPVCILLTACGGGGNSTDQAAASAPSPSAVPAPSPAQSQSAAASPAPSTTPAPSPSPAPVSGLATPSLGTINFSANFPVSSVTCGPATSTQFNAGVLIHAFWSNCSGVGSSFSFNLRDDSHVTGSSLDYGNATLGFAHYGLNLYSAESQIIDYANRTVTVFSNSMPLRSASAGAAGSALVYPLSIEFNAKLSF